MMILRAKKELDPIFSVYLLKCNHYRRLFERITGGSAVPQITSKQVAKLPFIYPPYIKQRLFSDRIKKCLTSKKNIKSIQDLDVFKSTSKRFFE
jgi:hypothetical protein